ncbi:S1C family serine protease [Oceanobacillus polygoni]
MMDNNNNDFHNKNEHDSNSFDQTDIQKEQIEASESVVSNTNERTYKSERNEPTSNKKRGFSGLLSGVLGGVISAVIVALLFTNNMIPMDTAETNTHETAEEASTPNIVETLASDEADVSTNINEVSQAVVGVVNMQEGNVWEGSQEAGTGSGIIYKKENGKAYIVTNQHVVANAKEVEIVLNDDERIPATVLGGDTLTDLAVLEVDGASIDTVANLGSSDDLAVGETVLAIGNPLGLDFANTVTKGIISGLNRTVEVDTNSDGQADWITEVLQTDAAINPGNSGGALVNSNGEVIGINSMKIAQSSVEGIGFAIPVSAALPIMEQLESGEISRPLIGISTASLHQVPPQYRYEINLPEDVEGGMVVADVQSGSPADAAGLQQFDVITKINGQEVTSILELRKYLYSETNIGDDIEIEYIRDGEHQTTNLKLVEQTEENE